MPILAIRRTMNEVTSGILPSAASFIARAASTSARGSAAYQYISGRLWSPTSSEWAKSPGSISQRLSSGSLSSAELRKIGAAARQRALDQHTAVHRAIEMESIFEQTFCREPLPVAQDLCASVGG